MTPKAVLVTGATDGIGLELARIYQSRGVDLHLLGRRRLEDLGDVLFARAQYYCADLAKPRFEKAVLEQLNQRGVGSLDLVIHNAGMGYYGPVEEQDADAVAELLAVNLQAPLVLSHALQPRLRAVRGKIVLIGSIASAFACPDYAIYTASKAALDGFARSLRAELDPQVSVQVILPGATRTGMHAKMGLSPEILGGQRFASAETVAAKIVRAIDGTRPRVVIGAGNRVLRIGGTVLGRPIDWLMARRRGRCAT